MYRRYFFLTLVLVTNGVSSQNVRVTGTLGGTAILPCSTNETTPSVYWRYADKTTVCDIIRGEVDFEEQDAVYKDRVETFPSEFAKGNFSIKLKKLQKSDAGVYTCNFPKILTPGKVQLTVKDSAIVMREPDSLVLFLLGCVLLSN